MLPFWKTSAIQSNVHITMQQKLTMMVEDKHLTNFQLDDVCKRRTADDAAALPAVKKKQMRESLVHLIEAHNKDTETRNTNKCNVVTKKMPATVWSYLERKKTAAVQKTELSLCKSLNLLTRTVGLMVVPVSIQAVQDMGNSTKTQGTEPYHSFLGDLTQVLQHAAENYYRNNYALEIRLKNLFLTDEAHSPPKDYRMYAAFDGREHPFAIIGLSTVGSDEDEYIYPNHVIPGDGYLSKDYPGYDKDGDNFVVATDGSRLGVSPESWGKVLKVDLIATREIVSNNFEQAKLEAFLALVIWKQLVKKNKKGYVYSAVVYEDRPIMAPDSQRVVSTASLAAIGFKRYVDNTSAVAVPKKVLKKEPSTTVFIMCDNDDSRMVKKLDELLRKGLRSTFVSKSCGAIGVNRPKLYPTCM